MARSRVLVIGDLMLDRDTFYTTVRVSGEGVPVLHLASETKRLGGAGAVALMTARLGADVTFISLIGTRDQRPAEEISQLITAARLRYHLIQSDRSQTEKNRVIIGTQQVSRIDVEDCRPIEPDEADEIALGLKVAGDFDVILVSDYGKGLITPDVLAMLRGRGRIIIDPARESHWCHYRGAACITPNRAELGDRRPEDCVRSLGLDCLIAKQDREGMLVYTPDRDSPTRIHSAIRHEDVVDVCGAGDMVLAALGVAIAEGQSWREAASFANRAAAAKCRNLGAVPITREEIDAVH
jgi:D-beta-D-heptose 7-phosphate kinase/D-beta-D-heptose 1-phosphate adenosyltransferase